MAIFEWSDAYNGGIAVVDEQHQHLVEMINELDEAFASGVEQEAIYKLYQRLAEYCVYHFGTEEQLMEGRHCDPVHMAHHRRAHQEFVHTVGNLRESLDHPDRETVDALLDYLIKWLVHHTQGEDKEMARLISGAETVLDTSGAEHERFLQRALDQEVAQRHLMAALRESELRFRAIADDVPVLIWMAERDGRRSFFNQQWLNFTGRTVAEEKGEGWVAGIHAEDAERVRQVLAAAQKNHTGYSVEYRLRQAGGGYGWLQETGVPRQLKDVGFSGFVGTCFDITERKRTQHVLELARDQLEKRVEERTRELSLTKELLEADIEERKRFQAEVESLRIKYELILNSAGIGIYGVDEAFKTTFINPAAERLLGWEAKDLLGRGVHDLVHHTHPDGRSYPVEECPVYNAVREGEARQVEDEVFWNKNGKPFDVEYTITPMYDLERISGAVVMFNDISTRKQAERELQLSYSALKELNTKLVEAQNQLLQSEKMASIGQLAAGVAHEINNPIGFINSNLGTLQRYVDDLLRLVDAYDGDVDDGRKVAKEIDLAFLRQDIVSLVGESRDGVMRVKRIVQDLREFSHVDEAEWQWTAINKGLESTLNVVWNEVKYKAEVVKEYGDLPEVYCLPHQLNQVFMNLLVNAAQAIEGRGVITLRTRQEGEGVQIEVADTGKGIPAEILPRIFDPFFTTKPVGKGTGLGLSLAYGIVEKHKGRIEVESEEGKGATFRVWLPLSGPENATK